MAESRSPDEVRANYVEAMGNDLGQLHTDLWIAVVAVCIEWREYLELFGTNDDRLRLLNETAPQFFGMIGRILAADVILCIARLTDRPDSNGKANVSVRRYPLFIDEPLKERVEPLLTEALEKCGFARPYRNRLFAHSDLLTVRREHPEPLPDRTRGDVDEALKALQALLNAVEYYYRNSTTAFDMAVRGRGAESVITYLERGVRGFQEDMEADH